MKYFTILFICSLLNGNETYLEKLLSIAFENNDKIQSQTELIDKQKSNSIVAGSLPDPSLSAGYFLSPIETKTGPQEWKIGITQNIPGFGKLSTKEKIGLLQTENEVIKLQKTRLEIQRQVITIYENLRFQKTQLEIIEYLLGILQNLESVMTIQYSTSTENYSNLIQIQLEVLKQNDNLIAIQNEKEILLSELEYLLGAEILNKINFNEVDLNIPDFDNISSNPDLLSVLISVNIAKTKLHLANLSYFPDFSLGADYISLGYPADQNPIDIRLGISLPIWFGKNNARKSSAQAELSSVEFLISDVEESLKAQAKRLSYEMENLLRRIQLIDGELIPKAEISQEVSETAYLSNEIDFDQFMDSIQILLNLKLEKATSLQKFQITKARLFELIGKTL